MRREETPGVVPSSVEVPDHEEAVEADRGADRSARRRRNWGIAQKVFWSNKTKQKRPPPYIVENTLETKKKNSNNDNTNTNTNNTNNNNRMKKKKKKKKKPERDEMMNRQFSSSTSVALICRGSEGCMTRSLTCPQPQYRVAFRSL